MKKEEYVRAVSGIRWTDEQRRAIEAKLSKPFGEQPEVQTEPASEEDEEQGFVEVFHMNMHEDEVKVRNSVMAKEARAHKRMGRIGWIIVAAAILAAGGAVGAGVAYSKKQKDNGGDAQGVFNLHLNADSDDVGRHQLQYTGNGYYTLLSYANYETVKEDGREVLEQNWMYDRLSYTDAETGEYSVLCARPNCTHDGSLYCPATTKAYDLGRQFDYESTGPVYADGYLYMLASKPDDPDLDIWEEAAAHPEKYGENYNVMASASGLEYIVSDAGALINKAHQVLIRYEPDGSGIEEIHDFGVGAGVCKPVYHRGYLWFSVQLLTYGDVVEHPISHNKDMFINGGYEIWGYELKTGELVKVYTGMGDPTLNHVDERPNDIFGAGDYLFLSMGNQDWVSGGGYRKLNLLTGEMTAAPDLWLYNGFNDKYVLKYIDLSQERSANVEQTGWYRTDLMTGENTLLPELEFNRESPHLYGDYIIVEKYPESSMEYRYGRDDEEIKLSQKNKSECSEIRICDLDGKVLAEVPMPEVTGYQDDLGVTVSEHFSAAADGMLYVRVGVNDHNPGWVLESHVVCCPIQDILDGKCEWKKAYETSEEKGAKENYETRLAQEKKYEKEHK